MVADDGHTLHAEAPPVALDAIAEALAAGDGEALEAAIDTLLAGLPGDRDEALSHTLKALAVLQDGRAFDPSVIAN